MCVSLFYVIDTGSIGSRARIEMGVTYLPFTVSSDAGYADRADLKRTVGVRRRFVLLERRFRLYCWRLFGCLNARIPVFFNLYNKWQTYN